MIGRNPAIELWGRWRRLAGGTINQRIFSAAVVVTLLSLVVNALSFAKEILAAAAFGTSDAMDAFLIALVIPQTAIGVVASPFYSALLPAYIRTREHEGQAAAQRLVSGIVALALALLGAVAILLALASPFFLPGLAAGFGPEKLALTQGMLLVLLPGLILGGVITIWSSVLAADERFALASVVPALIPIITIACIVAFGARLGTYTLALGMVAGLLLQLIAIGQAVRRQGLRLRPRWPGADATIRDVIHQYLPLVAAQLTMGSTALIDLVMASSLDAGSVAALGYGGKVVVVLTGLAVTGVSTAILPYFSKMIAVGDWAGVRQTLKTYAGLILLATVPITLLLCLFSEPIIRLLLQRGAFSAADTTRVAQIQVMLALGIPFYTLAQLFVRLISSMRASAVLLWGNIINWSVNIAMNYLLMQTMGVAGIALATSLVYMVSLAFLATMTWRRLAGR